MSTALSDRDAPSDSEERIYRALKKMIEAFFEGHETSAELQDAYLKRIRKDLIPPVDQKIPDSRVKIASARDINRMWAAHAKAQRKRK
jgi:hypothetical protein